MAGARALWRATGMKDGDFDKPIIAVVNSFTQFVPGHVHLKDLGQLVAREIEASGGVAKEFNTIAVDDGIAMGHGGMLYSLPSRDLIADSVEYMVNAHCADAMVCISNCDKITPGMLMAAMRLNIPVVFVSGGPMEAGKVVKVVNNDRKIIKLDLVDAMIKAGDSTVSDADVAEIERSACPTCGSCSGMFTANSMNCLTEALGLSLPGNGTIVATHADRKELFLRAGRLIVDLAKRHYEGDDYSVLPRSIATKAAFENAMALDVSMGGSTNTVLHLLAAAHEAQVEFTMADIDRISRQVPCLCKVAPMTDKYHIEDVHRAGGIISILGELARAGLLDTSLPTVHSPTMGEAIEKYDIKRSDDQSVHQLFRAAPGGVPTQVAFSQSERFDTNDLDRSLGCIRDREHAYSQDGGLAVLYGNIAEKGCIVKTAGVDESILKFSGKARVFESQDAAVEAILGDTVHVGDVVIIRYEGPKGGPGMQEMLYPTSYIKSKGLGKACALFTDGRFSGGSSGLVIGHASPEAAEGGAIGLVEEGDMIDIDIPARTINLRVSFEELAHRRGKMEDRGAAALEAGGARALRVAGAAGVCGADHLGGPRRGARSQPAAPLIRTDGRFAGHLLLPAVLPVLGTIHLQQRAVIQAHRRQLPAPHAAAVEPHEVRPQHQSQCRPVPEHHGDVGRAPLRQVEPRQQARALRPALAFLVQEIHAAVGCAQAHPRQRIDDAAQARHAGQAVVPLVRLVPVHLGQEADPALAAQHGFDFVRERHRLRRIPRRRDAGMHQQVCIDEHRQRAVTQPLDQFIAVGRGQDLVERIGAAGALRADGHRDQVQVVVAEQGFDAAGVRFGQRLHAAQCGQRIRATVDQVADEKDARLRIAVALRILGDACDQELGFMGTALQVADGIGSHVVLIDGGILGY